MSPYIPNYEVTKLVLKTIRGHKNVAHTPYYLQQILSEAGVDYSLYQRWMTAGAMMHKAPASETRDFVGNHVLQRHCTHFYETITEQLARHTELGPVRELHGPQRFIDSKVYQKYGMSLTDYLLQFLYGRYYLNDACHMVHISRSTFWRWFRWGRLGSSYGRFRDFYTRTRFCLLMNHVFEDKPNGQEEGKRKIERRWPQVSSKRRRVREVVRKRAVLVDH